MPVASIISGITDALTTVVGDYGLYAVFLLMALDAVFPAASEAVMVYGGAVAAGAFPGQDVQLFGWTLEPGLEAYLGIALAGTIGYTLGAMGDKADRWFERWEDWAVFLGRLTPLVRSFVSIPAGVFEVPFRRYTILTFFGSAIWCFGFAGIGWALGSRWEDFHDTFHYVDYVIVVLVVAGVAWLAWKYLRRRGKPATEPR